MVNQRRGSIPGLNGVRDQEIRKALDQHWAASSRNLHFDISKNRVRLTAKAFPERREAQPSAIPGRRASSAAIAAGFPSPHPSISET